MNEITEISRLIDLESMFFRSLREKGIEELRKKTGQVWSDHNLHDPGITILEALCYIITELGNQLNFSFGDLIATAKGITDAMINYPSAAINLPVKAVTIPDFRKILIDMPEIRNAYFDKTNESKIPVFLNPYPGPGLTPGLTYNQETGVTPIKWGGLYSIQLEMEDEDLNLNILNETIVVQMGPVNKSVDIIISFKYWDEVGDEWFRNSNISAISLEDTIVSLDDEQYEDYYSEWTISFSDGGVITDFPVWIKLVAPLVSADITTIQNLKTAIQNVLGSTSSAGPFMSYKSRLMAVKSVVSKANNLFHSNRNLGEDISCFTALRLQEIAMDAVVEIVPSSDPEDIYAQIIFNIESFFSPAPAFHSLEDLLAKADFETGNVFLGPLLNSGFLSEENLNSLSKGNIIYVSDLVHLILDIHDIVTVRDISLSTYFNNFQAIIEERNCLKIRSGFRPKLSIKRSRLVLTRQGVAVNVDMIQVDAKLSVLRTNASVLPGSSIRDLDIPFGNMPLAGDYRSVQCELPAVYGTGSAGIPDSSPPERAAQLKQLQGYLFLFDQILANTYSQLANIGDYFAVHQTQSKSYYHYLLYNVPGAKDLIGHLATSDTWENFIAKNENGYTKLLDDACEPGDTFFQRRNTVLDYLLARTAESRQDYAALLYSLPGKYAKDIILHDKENFLEKYPVLSKARAQAYNYMLRKNGVPDVWDSENTGGYEKMVCEKLGFPSHRKHTLFHPLGENFEFLTIIVPQVRRKFELKDNGGNPLMISQNHFADDAAATEVLTIFLDVGRYRENYEIIAMPGGMFSFRIAVAPVDMIYSGLQALASESDAENAIRLIMDIIGEKYSLEGLHIVEHILLRPFIKGATEPDSDKLFKLIKSEDNLLNDPYSNVVTIVLPSGMERNFSVAGSVATPSATGSRMRDAAYRMYAEQTILREAPAHLLVNIFFLDIDTDPGGSMLAERPSLQIFERTFKAWCEAVADISASPNLRRTTQRQLVKVLENIYGA